MWCYKNLQFKEPNPGMYAMSSAASQGAPRVTSPKGVAVSTWALGSFTALPGCFCLHYLMLQQRITINARSSIGP